MGTRLTFRRSPENLAAKTAAVGQPQIFNRNRPQIFAGNRSTAAVSPPYPFPPTGRTIFAVNRCG